MSDLFEKMEARRTKSQAPGASPPGHTPPPSKWFKAGEIVGGFLAVIITILRISIKIFLVMIAFVVALIGALIRGK